MSTRIRPAGRHGVGRVRECVRAAYSRYAERIGKKPAPALADHAALIEAGEVCVLTENEEILGGLMMRSQKDHLFVETVAVWPQRQGEGIGRKLMAFAEERARELGLQEVRLYTNE
jgi:GNAT superfamily N-acetyltransferase